MMSLSRTPWTLPTRLMSHLIIVFKPSNCPTTSCTAMQLPHMHFVIGHHQNNNTRHTFEGIGSDLNFNIPLSHYLYRACNKHIQNKRDKKLSKLYQIKTIYTHHKTIRYKLCYIDKSVCITWTYCFQVNINPKQMSGSNYWGKQDTKHRQNTYLIRCLITIKTLKWTQHALTLSTKEDATLD